MAKSRKFLTAGAIGVAALALIGAGASATFTTATDSNHPVTAGTIHVVLSSADAPGCTAPSNGCTSLTFPAVGPVGSTFETATHRVIITNVGDIPVMEKNMVLSDWNNGSTAAAYLRAQMNVCVRSGYPADGGPWTVANGKLTTGEALSPSVLMGTSPSLALPANGGTDYYDVSFYAGQDSTCGTISSAGTNTASAWGSYSTPASLTNEAMGGSVTPKITFNYTG